VASKTQTPLLAAQIRKLFEDCLDLNAECRDAFLSKAAAGNQELLDEVRALLAAHEKVESLDPIGAVVARETSQMQPPPPLPTLEAGRRLSDFVIIRKLGAGGFGDVYLALQISLGRNIALKVSRKDSPEARTMARLKHSNIVQVHAAMRLEEIDAPAICMQYVPGVTLAELLTFLRENPDWNGEKILAFIDQTMGEDTTYGHGDQNARARFATLNQEEVVGDFLVELARALNYAHSKNVLHLDVKPSNILIGTNGDALLSDFNVSLRQDRPGDGQLGGTPEYMAPEILGIASGILTAANLDGRADIYSLGIVIGKLLDCLKHKERAVYLNQIVATCTNRDRKARFANGDELIASCTRQRKLQDLIKRLDTEQKWWLYRWGLRWPKTVTILAIIIPNAVASVIQVYYNQIHILGPLSEHQRQAFISMLAPWNSAIYFIGFSLIWMLYKDFFKVSSKLSEPMSKPVQDAARRSIVKTPFWAMVLISTSWTIGCLLFVLGLAFLSGPLPQNAIHHFIISFVLAMAIPLAFCLLSIGYLNVAAFYPRLLSDVTDLRTTIPRETRGISRAMKAFRFLAGAFPLAGAVVAVIQGPGSDPATSYPYQYLVIAFIAVGLVGIIFAVNVVDRFDAAIMRLNEASH
jgi:serine/threonine protein kinase